MTLFLALRRAFAQGLSFTRRYGPVAMRALLAAFLLGRALVALTTFRLGEARRLVRLAFSLVSSGQGTPLALREVATAAVGLSEELHTVAPFARRIAAKSEKDLAPMARALLIEEMERAKAGGPAPSRSASILANPTVGRWMPVAIVVAIGSGGIWLGLPAQPLPTLSTSGADILSESGFAATMAAALLVHVFLRYRARAQVALARTASGESPEADTPLPLSAAEIEARLAAPLKG